jgi:hypothetical protein
MSRACVCGPSALIGIITRTAPFNLNTNLIISINDVFSDCSMVNQSPACFQLLMVCVPGHQEIAGWPSEWAEEREREKGQAAASLSYISRRKLFTLVEMHNASWCSRKCSAQRVTLTVNAVDKGGLLLVWEFCCADAPTAERWSYANLMHSFHNRAVAIWRQVP